ncbi:MAG: 3-dehydroquinate synthase [bacterium]
MPITSKFIVGEPLKNIADLVKHKKDVIVLSDFNVSKLYDTYFPSKKTIIVGTGENIKTLDTVNIVYDRLLNFASDRTSFLIAIGGGIVCDIAGFAASTFMRGIDFAFVPTTLLAQVDASIGGKNGVNFKGYKNIVGAFRQPEFVFYNFQFLKTLNSKDYACGIAETIKHSLLTESDLFSFLVVNNSKILSKDEHAIKRIVSDSIKIKSNIVNMDEFEAGERKKLNFGHTLAHALEKVSSISHGEAVAIGMMFSARFSCSMGLLSASNRDRIQQLLELYGLPTETENKNIRKDDIIEAISKDKKKELNDISFVFIKDIGDVEVKKIPLSKLEEAIIDLC